MNRQVKSISHAARASAFLLALCAGMLSIIGSGTTSGPAPDLYSVACAGRDQQVKTGAFVQLDGRCSEIFDEDGTEYLTYHWYIMSSPPASQAQLMDDKSPNPAFTADREGEYLLRLYTNVTTATTQSGAEDFVTITATTANSPPVAHPGFAIHATKGATVVLDGSGSTDPDGDTLSHS